MPNRNLKHKTAKGLFWGGFSNLIQQALGGILFIVVARILTPGDYGLIAMLTIFSVIANSIMDAGFSSALINKKEIVEADYTAVFWFSFFSAISMYVVLFLCAPLIAVFYDEPALTGVARILFLSFIFSSCGIAHNALLLKKMMIKQKGLIDVVAVVSSGIVGIILALKGFSYWTLVIQQVVQSFIGTILRWYFSGWVPSLVIDFTPIKKMFSFSSKVFLNNILGQISANIFTVLLGKFYTKNDTGYYSQAQKWLSLGNTVIIGMIQSVAQPVLVEVQSDPERQKKVFRKMLRFGAFVSFPALLGLAFVSYEFILITVGPNWMESVPYLQILSCLSSFSFITLLYNNLLLSHGKPNLLLYGNICFYTLNLIVAFLLVKQGVFILIFSCTLFSSLLLTFGWHFLSKNLIDISFKELLSDIYPYFLVALFSFALAYGITFKIENIYLSFALKVLLVATIYSFVLWRLKSVIFMEMVQYLFVRK